MQTKKPLLVQVVGLLGLAIGGIGMAQTAFYTFFALGGHEILVGVGSAGRAVTIDNSGGLASKVPGYAAFEFAQLVAFWLVTFLYIAVGEGLVRSRPWARELAVGAGWVSLGHKGLWALFTICCILPFYRETRGTGQSTLTLATVPFLSAIYPVLLLWVVTQPDAIEYWKQLPTDEPTGKAEAPAPPVPPDLNTSIQGGTPVAPASEAIQSAAPSEPEPPAPPSDSHIQPA